MTNKEPYTITEHTDKTVTLTIGTISKTFRNRKALQRFAEQLHEQATTRWVGMFRLQDTDKGGVDLIFNKGGEIIHINNYEQAEKFAAMILADLSDEKDNGNR